MTDQTDYAATRSFLEYLDRPYDFGRFSPDSTYGKESPRRILENRQWTHPNGNTVRHTPDELLQVVIDVRIRAQKLERHFALQVVEMRKVVEDDMNKRLGELDQLIGTVESFPVPEEAEPPELDGPGMSLLDEEPEPEEPPEPPPYEPPPKKDDDDIPF